MMLINSFSHLDNILQTILQKSLDVFKDCPQNLPELPFNYFSVMVNSKDIPSESLKKKIELNPIKISGRIAIIKGFIKKKKIEIKNVNENRFFKFL